MLLAVDSRFIPQRLWGDKPVMQKSKGFYLKYQHSGASPLTGSTYILTFLPSLRNFKMG